MRAAHAKTLARWVRLLKQERLSTIRQRRNRQASGTRPQKITKFFEEKGWGINDVQDEFLIFPCVFLSS